MIDRSAFSATELRVVWQLRVEGGDGCCRYGILARLETKAIAYLDALAAAEFGGRERLSAGKLDRQECNGTFACGDDQAIASRLDYFPGLSVALGHLGLMHNPSNCFGRPRRPRPPCGVGHRPRLHCTNQVMNGTGGL